MYRSVLGLRSRVMLLSLSLPLLGLAQFSFTPQSGSPFSGLDYSASAFGDVNNDGLPDLVVAGRQQSGNPSTSLYMNQGGGSFGAALELTSDAPRVWFAAIGMADVDNDGDLDILITGRSGTNGPPDVSLYLNGGAADGSLWTRLDDQATGLQAVEFGSITFGHFTDDNLIDVLITGHAIGSSPTAVVYKNQGNGQWAITDHLEGVTRSSSAAGHFFGDSHLGLVIGGESYQGFAPTNIYQGDGTGQFVKVAELPAIQEGAVVVADVNNNDDLYDDIFITGLNDHADPCMDGEFSYQQLSSLYLNVNGDFFLSGAAFAAMGPSSALFTDFDGDGDPDLVISGNNCGSVKCLVYRNVGSSAFAFHAQLQPAVFHGSLSAADVDSDCDLDLFTQGESPSTSGYSATLYLNNGGTPSGPYYADADGDGYGDPFTPVWGCPQPAGTVTNALDCDDNDDLIYVGATCDDGDILTAPDVFGEDCICAGEPVDCLGVPNGTALPGTPCNDNNCGTTGDSYNTSCECTGNCVTTQLSYLAGTSFSCGASKKFGTTPYPWEYRIFAMHPWNSLQCGTTNNSYQFRFKKDGVCIKRQSSSNQLNLNWTDGPGLTCGVWQVDVRRSINGAAWCPGGPMASDWDCDTPWGPVCTLTIIEVVGSDPCGSNLPQQGLSALHEVSDLSIYPNPNNGAQFLVSLKELPIDCETVDLDLFDMSGKRVLAERLPVQYGLLNATVQSTGTLNAGVYMARCAVGDQVYTQRMVVQP